MKIEKLREMGKLPVHIAVIIDGNGRWAKKRGLPRTAGHKVGAETFRSIATYCQANAVMTIKEYLCDYASPACKAAGERVIENELPKITHEKVRLASIKRLKRIEEGERDFRF